MDNVSNLKNVEGTKILTSFDPGKVWLSNEYNKTVCHKYSSMQEVVNNNRMAQMVRDLQLKVDDMLYKILVPKVYEWNDSKKILSMEYCEGKNLEFILRDKKTYLIGIKILNELLNLLINKQIYWIDFAPRNILIENDVIHIIDFEKGFGESNISVKEFLQNHVYEEYGSFSFLEDRLYTPNEVFDITSKESDKKYYIPDIGPKRIKAVAKLLGYEEWLTKKEYLSIIKMFIIAEQPEIENGEFIFPRVYLEQILKDKNTNPIAFDNYALEVLKRNEEKGAKILLKGRGEI